MPKVVLRETRDAGGYRYLDATLTEGGDVVFTGQDLGDAVERFFGEGNREYEWTWTIRAPNVPKLAAALSAGLDVLAAIRDRFSGDRAKDVSAFLDDHGIVVERWSRVGD